ncbi:IS5/IS1182 family transposase, partial [Candidatus Parcubacteria bacterium]
QGHARGFRVQPKRWIVEYTFGWLTRARPLVKDHERNLEHSETFIHLRMTALMLRCLHPRNK